MGNTSKRFYLHINSAMSKVFLNAYRVFLVSLCTRGVRQHVPCAVHRYQCANINKIKSLGLIYKCLQKLYMN